MHIVLLPIVFKPLFGKSHRCTKPVKAIAIAAAYVTTLRIITIFPYATARTVVFVTSIENDTHATSIGLLSEAGAHRGITIRIAFTHVAVEGITRIINVLTHAVVIPAVATASFFAIVFLTTFVTVTVVIVIAADNAVRTVVFPTFASAIKIAGAAARAIATIGFVRVTNSIVVAFVIGRIVDACKGIGKIAALAVGTWGTSLRGVAVHTFEDQTMPIAAAIVGAFAAYLVTLDRADAWSGRAIGRQATMVARALVILVAANASKAAGELPVVVAFESGVA